MSDLQNIFENLINSKIQILNYYQFFKKGKKKCMTDIILCYCESNSLCWINTYRKKVYFFCILAIMVEHKFEYCCSRISENIFFFNNLKTKTKHKFGNF